MCSISTRGAVGWSLEAAVAVAAGADAVTAAEVVVVVGVELAVHDHNDAMRRAATIQLAPEGVNVR